MDVSKLGALFANPVKGDECQTKMAPRDLVAAASEEYSCEFGSSKYFALCAFGGVLSCGITHTAVTPLDLVKCRLQVDKEKYKSIGNGFKVTLAEGGAKGLVLGWAPTAIGYSAQGLCKFGFYEVFKKIYSDMIGEENTYLYRTSLYLASSASAEFFADIALSPMEACKVRMQTSPVGTFPTTLRGAFPQILKNEGVNGFYKSLVPLWCRQIPYTMMKFACFERTVEAIYQYVVPSHVPSAASLSSWWSPSLPDTSLESSAPSCPTQPTPWSPISTRPRALVLVTPSRCSASRDCGWDWFPGLS